MSKPTLAEFLAAVKGRCEKATKGPWASRLQAEYFAQPNGHTDRVHVLTPPGAVFPVIARVPFENNKDFIVHSRADVEVLLKMVDLARGLSSHIDKASDQFCLDCGADLEEMMEALIPEEKP